MPSDKKRINLTIPDNIYQQLQTFKADNGITNDATACLQLIVQQLKAQENEKLIRRLINGTSIEQLRRLNSEGIALLEQERKKLT